LVLAAVFTSFIFLICIRVYDSSITNWHQ